MAEVYVVCKMLCVIFLLICAISSVHSISDSYLYKVHSHVEPDSTYTSFVLQNSGVHTINKREDAKRNFSAPLPVPIKTTAVPEHNEAKFVLEMPKKNLGENGTGIRKNITHEEGFNITTTVSNVTNEVAETIKDAKPTEIDDPVDTFSTDNLNSTLTQNNITKTQVDNHQYYNSTFTVNADVGKKYWVDMTNRTDVEINGLLSKSHRRAATIKLSFDFPFYGHIVRNVTIATGGFLYTGEYVHSWLAATQYIAPLMANFDTSLSNDSVIKYVDNGTAFTVQWDKVYLQDKPKEGNFTFQVTLKSNGDIVFVYEHVPEIIEDIIDEHHPVKVGLSDAYIIDRTVFFIRRKTIYEYHRVNFKQEDIKNWTVIYLTALPTCLSNKNCSSCVSNLTSGVQCMWCPGSSRCSNGMDRYRQDWLLKGCDRKQIREDKSCADADMERPGSDPRPPSYEPEMDHVQNSKLSDNPRQESQVTHDGVGRTEKPVRMGISGIVSILFLIAFVGGLAIWVLYAYRYPHTTSGQILIRYRPSQWSWRRGEARYTAATIHM